MLLGVFARIQSLALSEDLPIQQKGVELKQEDIDKMYFQMSTNCFIASGLYAVVLIFSGHQYWSNSKSTHISHW